jgi:hypothetical protein
MGITMKNINKILEFLYDTLIFSIVMLLVLSAFLGLTHWFIFRSIVKVNAAPAPFAKKERVKAVGEGHQAFYYGTWKCTVWGDWRLSFMPGGKYSAILDDSIWEGTWKVSFEENTYYISIEEYPLSNPTFNIKYRYPTTNFTRFYEITD